MAAILLLPFAFWGEEIFVYVFGIQWKESEKMELYLIPITIFGFAAYNVSNVYSVTNSNHLLLIWQVLYFVGEFFIIVLSSKINFYTMLLLYSIWGSLAYIILALGGYWLLFKTEKNQLIENV